MNAPYNGKFRVTQIQHAAHDGLDMVGIDSKDIHSTVTGVVKYAGWENPKDEKQGFGLYVCVESGGKFYYFGHLSEIKVNTGDRVKITDTIGIEGNTGKSTGNHCHYCVRPQFSQGNALNVSEISGIPNTLGVYDDGYRPPESIHKRIEIYIDGQKKYTGLLD